MSRPRISSSRSSAHTSSSSRFSGPSYAPPRSSFSGLTSEYDFAAAYGPPALSDGSSDEQIAHAISESKKTALFEAQFRTPSLSRSSSTSSWTLVDHEPRSRPTSESARSRASSRVSSGAQTPTPRYAADEVIARNLARTWQVASVQSDIIANPSYAPGGPPLVVRAPSPSAYSISSSSSSSSSTALSYYPPTPGPLSPLPLPTRALSHHSVPRSPSIRSIPSISSIASTRSISSVSSAASRNSLASLISSVARSSRHAPLESAARTLRASLPPSLARSASSVSIRSRSSRTGSVRSVSTTASRRSAGVDENVALSRFHVIATTTMPCKNPGCGGLMPPPVLDNIFFPTTVLADASPPRALFAALHARCPACTQNHCRGCGQPTGCDAACCGDAKATPSPAAAAAAMYSPRSSISSTSTSPPSSRTHYDALYPPAPCPVPTHCSAVRALGALASLVAFDRAHSAIREGAAGRMTDKALLAPLHALTFFLAPPAHLASPSGTSLLLLPGEREGVEPEEEPDAPEADPALPALVRLSRVPAYAASLLRVGDVGRWIDRAPAYGAVLRVLRALGDAGCASVLVKPVPVAGHSGATVEAWLRRGATTAEIRAGGNGNGAESLRGVIRRLDPVRAALLRLAGALDFGPTVQQAHALCDGVLYLLLQDVLGDDEG